MKIRDHLLSVHIFPQDQLKSRAWFRVLYAVLDVKGLKGGSECKEPERAGNNDSE